MSDKYDKPYAVASGSNIRGLVADVADYMCHGYVPAVAMTITDERLQTPAVDKYFQPMVKVEPK